MTADLSCLTCARYRACPDCGYGLFDLIPRSVDPVWLRCSRCGGEISMPMHFHPWDEPGEKAARPVPPARPS